jgi:hypothetical protein
MSADRGIRAAKIDRDRKARSSQQITSNENCCPEVLPAKVPRLLGARPFGGVFFGHGVESQPREGARSGGHLGQGIMMARGNVD